MPNPRTNLGVLYARGLGVEKDYKQAVAWYRKAVMQNLPQAQFNLGTMYLAGAWCQTGCQTGQTLVYEGGSAGVAGSAEKSGQDAEKRADHQYGSLDLIFGMDILVLCRA